VALCPNVASLTVNQFDCCNLLWRSVIRYGTGKTSYWRLLTLSLLKNLMRRLLQSSSGQCWFSIKRRRRCRLSE
jgi:hypothetical protein